MNGTILFCQEVPPLSPQTKETLQGLADLKLVKVIHTEFVVVEDPNLSQP
jgi:hypothetical protein